MDDWQNSIFAHLVIFLNLVLAGLRLGLKNYQVGETRSLDDYSYLYRGLIYILFLKMAQSHLFEFRGGIIIHSNFRLIHLLPAIF
ncbi:hypothetical protein THERMOS_66 [Bathymodiolus thermophilus thioautotrophic gill symbiont]|uniref:Uncharacterized protein n=1 Tax=Bathymodiolus thermophilus thioautotrophic gill symbiont TaxID=2360 RepID=A0A8H8XCN2_9GAMM|nr:hypothetical protein THERMOS_66 [Bathymodiolus thermophilus thioautotrophic gill symbiont]